MMSCGLIWASLFKAGILASLMLMRAISWLLLVHPCFSFPVRPPAASSWISSSAGMKHT